MHSAHLPLRTEAPDYRGPDLPAPVGVGERIRVIDALRGIALFGMLVVHFSHYTTGAMTAVDRGVQHAISLFFEARFWTMFGILFGVGFAVQARRSDALGKPVLARYMRRLAALAAFGLVAEVVFGYRVLLMYALWGIPLILVRRWSTGKLLLLTLACVVSLSAYWATRPAILSLRGGEAAARTDVQAHMTHAREARDELRQANASPEWTVAMVGRLRDIPHHYSQPPSFLPTTNFTLFLLGLLALRLGVFERPAHRYRVIAGAMVFGVASWAAAEWLVPSLFPASSLAESSSVAKWVFANQARSGFGIIASRWLALAYIGAVLLLIARNGGWLRFLAPFEWAGRMALTNYMTQVMCLAILFTPQGLHMRMTVLVAPLAAAAMFAGQVILSRWWLSHFLYGPLEWVWRSITYWSPQPLRITPIKMVQQPV